MNTCGLAYAVVIDSNQEAIRWFQLELVAIGMSRY